MNAVKRKRIIKAVKTSLSALWWGVLALLLVLFVTIFAAKMKGEVPRIFGYSVMNIVSGSMEDEISKDSYILIKKTSPEKIEKGDIICFYSQDPTIYKIPNTHRVVEEPIVTDSGIEFVTKGDANLIEDRVRARGEDLIGVYVKSLDGLTSFSNILKGKTLIIVIIGLQICIISMFVCTSVLAKKSKTEEPNMENEKKN